MRKLFFWFFTLVFAVSFFIGCGQNKSSTNNVAINPYANNNGCPVGTAYTNGFCYGQGTNQPWNGYLNGYSASIDFVSDNFQYRDARVSDAGAYRSFIKKAMQTCERAENSGGIYNCDSWVSGYYQLNVQITSVQSQNLRATFSAYPQTNGGYWYGYSLPSFQDFFYGLFGFPVYYNAGVVRNPLPLDMVVSVINDSKGFEARAYGDQLTEANRSLIQLQVLNGKLQDQNFDYRIAFEGKIIVTGKLQRYQ